MTEIFNLKLTECEKNFRIYNISNSRSNLMCFTFREVCTNIAPLVVHFNCCEYRFFPHRNCHQYLIEVLHTTLTVYIWFLLPILIVVQIVLFSVVQSPFVSMYISHFSVLCCLCFLLSSFYLSPSKYVILQNSISCVPSPCLLCPLIY
jgi:hypothetical protein